jgi:5,10-methenyltetrahydromethanopterin hydrogenase
MKPAKEWPVVQEARRVVSKQMEHYNEMMKDKTDGNAWPTPETAKRKLTDQQIQDAVNAMSDKQTKPPKKKLYLVDTIVTFRHKYVIEADELEHAYDEVTMKDSGVSEDAFEEVTQRYLGETITDGREITKKDFKQLLKTLEKDKDEMSSYWLGKDLIRKIDYDK